MIRKFIFLNYLFLLFIFIFTIPFFETQAQEVSEQTAQEQAEYIEPPKDLIIIDLLEGTGRIAENGKEIAVHYEGWLFDPNFEINNNNPDIESISQNYCEAKGRPFDSSINRGAPFSFFLGKENVIVGWEKGVLGMQEDGKRCLIIPPHLAYGNRSVGGGLIPANSTLIFEIILLGVR